PLNQDRRALLSPWWSEESTPLEEPKKETKDKHENYTALFHHQRYIQHETDKDINWSEKCYILASIPYKYKENISKEENIDFLLGKSIECSMVCFLRESQKLVKQRLHAEKKNTAERQYSPLHSIWITIARTPERCKEHLYREHIAEYKASHPIYYTLNLANQISYSSTYISYVLHKAFDPLRRISERYMNSWKDGSQQRFFADFCTRLERGDALLLARRAINNILDSS
ncbi:hypothetical protein BY458DRAFT_418775, partial [Sporodiniella umbellata]